MVRQGWLSLSTEVVIGRGSLQCAGHEGNFPPDLVIFSKRKIVRDRNLFLPEAPMPAL